MTIEFRCGTCQKLLRTTDDKAGATAKCPQCGTAVVVPNPPPAAKEPAAEEDFGSFETGVGDEEWAPPKGAGPKSSSGTSGPTRPCPMCGEQILAAATRCRFCGEELEKTRSREPRRGQLDAGTVINSAWTIFKSQMGITMGLVILGGVLNFGVAIGAQAVSKAAVGGMARGGNAEFAALVALVIQQVPPLLIGSFFTAGMNVGLLKVARGEQAEISDLFSGGRYYLRMLLMTFLFQLIFTIGLVVCIVPGVILALMFWPYGYVLVDRDPPGIGALSEAKDITQQTWGQVILLVLAGIGFTLLGVFAACVGLLFTIPLTNLMMAVAYCHMTGQTTADEQ